MAGKAIVVAEVAKYSQMDESGLRMGYDIEESRGVFELMYGCDVQLLSWRFTMSDFGEESEFWDRILWATCYIRQAWASCVMLDPEREFQLTVQYDPDVFAAPLDR